MPHRIFIQAKISVWNPSSTALVKPFNGYKFNMAKKPTTNIKSEYSNSMSQTSTYMKAANHAVKINQCRAITSSSPRRLDRIRITS